MENVKKEIKGNKLILTIDLDENLGRSKSGKTLKVASTNGFVWETVNNKTIGFSLNVNRKE